MKSEYSHICFQSVPWYLSTFPLCSGVYGGFFLCSIPSCMRNSVNHFPNSLPQSVRMTCILVVLYGGVWRRFQTNSILERTQCSECTRETMNLLQSSMASYCTSGLVLQKGKHTSSCTSCPGTSREYFFRLFLLTYSVSLVYRTLFLLRIRYTVD